MKDPALQNIVAAEVERLGAGAPIAVTVMEGVVTLTGAVQNDMRRILIEQELLRLPEVLDVRNHLHVAIPADDARVQLLALLEREDVATGRLKIAERNGVVTLSGEAASWFDRDAAERLAWEIPGVRAVENHITLPPDAVEPNLDNAGNPLA